MNIIYLLIPLAIIIAALLIWLFMWAIKSNQFDDLEGPAYKILMDDDPKTDNAKQKNSTLQQPPCNKEKKQTAKTVSDKNSD